MAPCRGAAASQVRGQTPVTPGSHTLPRMPKAAADGQTDWPDRRLRWNEMSMRGQHLAWSS